MLFILAVAVGVVLAAVAAHSLPEPRYSTLVRVAGAVAGFIVGYAGTYIVAAHVG